MTSEGYRDWRGNRVASALAGQNPTVLRRLAAGFAAIGDVQFLPGYSVLLVDEPHVERLSDLPKAKRRAFLSDMDALGEAVELACRRLDAEFCRVNLEILGNTDGFLHAHLAAVRVGTGRSGAVAGLALPARELDGRAVRVGGPARRAPGLDRRGVGRTGGGGTGGGWDRPVGRCARARTGDSGQRVERFGGRRGYLTDPADGHLRRAVVLGVVPDDVWPPWMCSASLRRSQKAVEGHSPAAPHPNSAPSAAASALP